MINNDYLYYSALKGGCLCHERWMPMPLKVDAYAVEVDGYAVCGGFKCVVKTPIDNPPFGANISLDAS